MERNRSSFNGEEKLNAYCLAKALFSNESEASDELAFSRGDVLTVLQQNPYGLQGWWLCSLRGRQGIAPSNRLRLLPGMYDNTGLGLSQSTNQINAPLSLSSIVSSGGARRKSWNSFHRANGKQNITDEYDFPTNHNDSYDYPTRATMSRQQSYDEPKPHCIVGAPDEVDSKEQTNVFYDIPRVLNEPNISSMSSSSSMSSNRSSSDASLSLSLEKSFTADSFYDIPRKLDIQAVPPPPERNHTITTQLYDIPTNKPLVVSEKLSEIYSKEVIIKYNVNEAKSVLCLLENECQKSITKLLEDFVTGTNWRSTLTTDHSVVKLKEACHQLRSVLHNFFMFGIQCLFNAINNCTDNELIIQLEKLLQQLRLSLRIIEMTTNTMDEKHLWTFEYLKTNKSDELDQLVCCTRGLLEDIKLISSKVRGNVRLIFTTNTNTNTNTNTGNPIVAVKPPIAPKPVQMRPLPPLPQPQEVEPIESPDYEDYVCLNQFTEKENQKLKDNLPKDLRANYEHLLTEIKTIPIQQQQQQYGNEARDQQIVLFYRSQMETHFQVFSDSMELFLQTVNRNHVPKLFINGSKFVVISAQKLVFIGLALERSLLSQEKREKFQKLATNLCDSLRALVLATKKAAQDYPSQSAVKQMITCSTIVTQEANRLQSQLSIVP